jgi:hypothetical protein
LVFCLQSQWSNNGHTINSQLISGHSHPRGTIIACEDIRFTRLHKPRASEDRK